MIVPTCGRFVVPTSRRTPSIPNFGPWNGATSVSGNSTSRSRTVSSRPRPKRLPAKTERYWAMLPGSKISTGYRIRVTYPVP